MATIKTGLLIALVTTVLAVVIQIDPFSMSPIKDIDFRPQNMAGLLPALNFSWNSSYEIANAKRLFLGQIFGPESIAFDVNGEGPYSGLSDGRVVKLDVEKNRITNFATTSPHWTPDCTLPIPGPNLGMEHICGRPLGLRFHPTTGDLYIADAYFGLLRVGKEGGLAKSLTTEAENVPFRFTNDLDFDENGNVFFTDSSTKYQRRQFFVEIMEGGAHGRLLKYNIASRQTTVLVKGLRFPNGVALSKDKTFLLFCETTLMRVQRYWLKGPKAGQVELFAQVPGWPDNIRLNPRGNFWVGIHAKRNPVFDFAAVRPWLRTLMLRMPTSIRVWYAAIAGLPKGLALELSGTGAVVTVLTDAAAAGVKAVSEIEEHGDRLWFGSVLMSYVAVSEASKQGFR